MSSTAVSLSFARLSRLIAERGTAQSLPSQQQETYALAAGILLAWLMMGLRLLGMVGLLAWPLFQQIWPMLSVMTLLSGLAALWFYQQGSVASGGVSDAEQLKNPFSLLAAAQFGVLFL